MLLSFTWFMMLDPNGTTSKPGSPIVSIVDTLLMDGS